MRNKAGKRKEPKRHLYRQALERIELLLDESSDWVGAMATVACELHQSFDYFHWTGFYRTVRPQILQVGPYQGGHGCLQIEFRSGVCGAAASKKSTQLVPDVREFPGHIGCSAGTLSEIVVPILSPSGRTVAVLDVDSDNLAAFDETDRYFLEELCRSLGLRFGAEAEAAIQRVAP